MRAISNRNILDAKFATADFDGPWLASFGRPALSGVWMVYGCSGSGKTTFILQLCKYLTRFGRVAYDSIEQGFSLSMQIAWKRVHMEEAGDRIILLDREQLKTLRERLSRRKSPDIIVIDSIKYMLGFKVSDLMLLKKEYPNKLFIFIAHEKNGEPDGALASAIKYDADIKIRTEGYKAFVTTRFEDAEKGEGGADFVIWDKGAQDYWVDKL